MDWWSVLVGVLVGVAVGFLASYPVGYLRELGRERAARRIRSGDEKQQRRRAEAAALAAAAERDAASQAEGLEIESLVGERVGAVFLRHVTRNDPGLRTTVVELDPKDIKRTVIVRYEASPDRPATPDDPPLDQRISIGWRTLTEPDADQRHRTARLIEQSYDDSDGWVEFERICR